MDVFQCDTAGVVREQRASLENPRISLLDTEAWDELFSDPVSSAGVRVSREGALKLSGYLRGVHLIAARIAELPLFVWEEKTADSYSIDRQHRANRFLRLDAMPGEMSALTLKHTTTAHALTHGNGFAYAPQNGAGEVQELIPLLPDRTRPVRIKGRLLYATSIGGTLEDEASEIRYLEPDEVIHIKGLGWDGYSGYSVLKLGREVLGGALATQQYANSFFGQGTAVGLVIESDVALSDTAYARLKNLWHKTRAGLKSAHKAAILEEGAKAKTLALSAQDAQLLESKKFDLTLIEHLLGLPPGKLSGRTNQRNAEADNQEFVDDCLSWWLTSWESELSRKLLTIEEYESERRKIMFDRKQLIRSNIASQASFWRTALGGRAWATQLEARRAMGLDPSKGEDNILEPLNMGSLQASADGGSLKEKYSSRGERRETRGERKTEARKQQARERRLALRATHQEIVREAVARMARRVSTFVERGVGQPTGDWLKRFDLQHTGVIREALSKITPLCTRLAKGGRQPTRDKVRQLEQEADAYCLLNTLEDWFLETVRKQLEALADCGSETSPESLARFLEGLPQRAAEFV